MSHKTSPSTRSVADTTEPTNSRQQVKDLQKSVEKGLGISSVKSFFVKIFEFLGMKELLKYIGGLLGLDMSDEKDLDQARQTVDRSTSLSSETNTVEETAVSPPFTAVSSPSQVEAGEGQAGGGGGGG